MANAFLWTTWRELAGSWTWAMAFEEAFDIEIPTRTNKSCTAHEDAVDYIGKANG